MNAYEQWQAVMANRANLLARVGNQSAPERIIIPTRRQVKQARKSFIKLARASQGTSMLNMPKPANHKPVPYIVGERDKKLFASHEKRQAAGWIRG